MFYNDRSCSHSPKINFEVFMAHEIDNSEGLQLPWHAHTSWPFPSHRLHIFQDIVINFLTFLLQELSDDPLVDPSMRE